MAARWRTRWLRPAPVCWSSSAGTSCHRNRRTGIPRRSGRTSGIGPRSSGWTTGGRPSGRTRTTASAGTRSSGAASCIASAGRTSRRSSTRTACPPRGRSTTTTCVRITTGRRRSTRCTARPGLTRRIRRGGPFPFPKVPHAEQVQQIVDDITAQGLHPSPLPLGLRQPGTEDGCILCNTCNSFPLPATSQERGGRLLSAPHPPA